jgi:hypothetical protein
LQGGGMIFGPVIASSGSILSPGTTAVVGALTISNTLTLLPGSTTLMALNKAANTNDQVRGLSSVTYAGTLTVTGVGGAYATNDVFKLFDSAAYVPSSFSVTNLPVGVTWDTSRLGVDGTIKVVGVTRPQITTFGSGTNGGFSVTFSGAAGDSYRLWASTNAAATPVASTWTVVANGVIGVTGVNTVTDATSTNYPTRFYLISVP